MCERNRNKNKNYKSILVNNKFVYTNLILLLLLFIRYFIKIQCL